MAIRNDTRHTSLSREKIKTSQLINRLQNSVLSEDEKDRLDSTQVRAIEILLKKSVPDLSAISIDMDATLVTKESVLDQMEDETP